MVDIKRAREWLENVKELENEIKALEAEEDRLAAEIGSKIYLKPRGVPDPDRVGGVAPPCAEIDQGFEWEISTRTCSGSIQL